LSTTVAIVSSRVAAVAVVAVGARAAVLASSSVSSVQVVRDKVTKSVVTEDALKAHLSSSNAREIVSLPHIASAEAINLLLGD
jgi:hypothetical protein